MKLDDILNSIAVEEAPDVNGLIYRWKAQLHERREEIRRRNTLLIYISLPVLFASAYYYFSTRINLELTKFIKIDFLTNFIERIIISTASISHSQTAVIWITVVSLVAAGLSLLWFFFNEQVTSRKSYIKI